MEAKRASLNSSCEYSQEPKTVLDLQQLVTQLQSKVQEQTKSLLIKERERRELRLQIETLEGGLKVRHIRFACTLQHVCTWVLKVPSYV